MWQVSMYKILKSRCIVNKTTWVNWNVIAHLSNTSVVGFSNREAGHRSVQQKQCLFLPAQAQRTLLQRRSSSSEGCCLIYPLLVPLYSSVPLSPFYGNIYSDWLFYASGLLCAHRHAATDDATLPSFVLRGLLSHISMWRLRRRILNLSLNWLT